MGAIESTPPCPLTAVSTSRTHNSAPPFRPAHRPENPHSAPTPYSFASHPTPTNVPSPGDVPNSVANGRTGEKEHWTLACHSGSCYDFVTSMAFEIGKFVSPLPSASVGNTGANYVRSGETNVAAGRRTVSWAKRYRNEDSWCNQED